MPGKGLFITFEGMDCSGKTTQMERLASWLRQRGRDVLCTREPGGTPMAESIRSLLLSRNNGETVTPEAELLLFGAARAQHVANVIAPFVNGGGIVLCDRFYDSTTAYQGYARGLDLDFIKELNCFCCGTCTPDLTFLFELPLKESRRRLAARLGGEAPDRLEEEDNRFHQAVHDGFLKIAELSPERIVVIDALKSMDEVTVDIMEVLKNAIE
ncbi:MAG: dTMP kinase [Victivallales bacterium]|nr:dTMP kinase [Victivallales bacterium]